ncbi:NAD(P)H-dependent oxidoreductase [Curvivirga aplysinae]|uniref:NAD(P)H-dependent oxidoreductase n=1 Tax=Curvivirga aplysinae TaxID=2529852 RepID=UPI0012BCDA50|nr:NAD(P)H-dependent oxidoreductase [Curvivirga aplysinae]MTI09909.1 flavodoxin family protein [Curvivirga aplysinae]
MKVFMVCAHPEPQSFNAAMARQTIETFEAAGHEIKVSDLYEMNWNPVASSEDFSAPKNEDYLVYALEQRNGFKTDSLAPDIQAEIAKLQWCDLLVLNFPLFWFSMPAIMKGWIDRVFVSGLCYGGLRIYDKAGMKGKKALVNLTLGGQTHMFDGDDSIHGNLEDMLKPLLRGSLGYVGFDVLPPFIGWHIPYISQEDREKVMQEHKDYLLNLDRLEPLHFVDTSKFDDHFHKLEN